MSVKVSMLWIVAGLALHFAFAFLAGVRYERGQAAKRENAALTGALLDARAAVNPSRVSTSPVLSGSTPLPLILRCPVNVITNTLTISVRRFRRCLQSALIWIPLLALTSCATGRQAIPEPILMLPIPPPPPIPARLMQPCPHLPMPESDRWSSLIANHDAVTRYYHLCRMLHQSLIEAAKTWEQTARRSYCAALTRAGIPMDMCDD